MSWAVLSLLPVSGPDVMFWLGQGWRKSVLYDIDWDSGDAKDDRKGARWLCIAPPRPLPLKNSRNTIRVFAYGGVAMLTQQSMTI